jgi:hypothetical protein
MDTVKLAVDMYQDFVKDGDFSVEVLDNVFGNIHLLCGLGSTTYDGGDGEVGKLFKTSNVGDKIKIDDIVKGGCVGIPEDMLPFILWKHLLFVHGGEVKTRVSMESTEFKRLWRHGYKVMGVNGPKVS